MDELKALLLSFSRLLQAFLHRSSNSVRQAVAIRREPGARGLALFATVVGLTLGIVWWLDPAVIGELSVDLLAGGIGAIFGVYFSLEIVRPYLRTVERQRIDSAPEILETYDEMYGGTGSQSPNFIDLDRVDAWVGGRDMNPFLDRIVRTFPASISRGVLWDDESRFPLTTVHEPSAVRTLDSYHCEPANADGGSGTYTVPEQLASLLEPYREEIRGRFLRENRWNQSKMRLDAFRDGRFVYSKTTYYRSFLTNFCPDFPSRSGASIRAITSHLLFDPDGETVPLCESQFSNHFGGGGLVVTTGGTLLLSVRSKTVAVEGNSKHLSFSGSFDYETVKTGGLLTQIESILEDETGISPEHVIEVCMLGVVRRVERLGKPDLVTLVLVDEGAEWEDTTEQFLSLDEVPLSSGTDRQFETIEEFFERDQAHQATRSIFRHLNDRAYPPSLGLVSAIYLLDSLAGEVS